MSSPRTDSSVTPMHLMYTLLHTSGAVLLTQPLRVGMNQASKHTSLRATISATLPRMFNGVGDNLLRGTLASGSQFFVKRMVQEQYGFAAGIVSAAFTGTLAATGVETRLIRKNNMPAHLKISPSLWYFSPTLSALYFFRELGFCMSVLAKKEKVNHENRKTTRST